MQKQAANRLAVLRESRGLKHVQIAALVDVWPSTVYRWEKGLSQIPDEKKLLLAEHFGVSRAYLMGWDDEPTDAAA